MSKLYRTVGVGANQQTADVTNEKIRYYKSESDLDTDLANISDDEVIFTQEGNDDRCGIPLGTVVGIMSNVVPQGFLPCNGVAFDEHQYPALYALLGDNHTPYSYDKSRLGDYESITISTDANNPTVMQYDGFITLQSASTMLQLRVLDNPALGTAPNIYTVYSNVSTNFATGTFPLRKGDRFYIDGGTVQNSAVRYYKHYLCIKATSGLTIEQQDYVLQSLLEADSYSTEEVATGKKWIDGKPIYRKVLTATNKGTSDFTFDGSITNLDTVVSGTGYIKSTTGTYAGSQFCIPRANEEIVVTTSTGIVQLAGRTTSVNADYAYLVVEYTKAN